MEIKVEQVPTRRVAYYRHVGPYPECGATWQRLVETAVKLGLMGPDTVLLGMGHDDPNVTPAEECRYDACVTVADDFEPTEDLQIQVIEGGNFATGTHKGSYEGLGHAYGAVRDWIQSGSAAFRMGPCFEIYHNDCNQVPEEELLTSIYLPVE